MQALREQHRAEALARIGVIELAIAALGTGELDEQRRCEAERTAHMLSGSLGMFGFSREAEAARELESELAHAAGAQASMLSALAAIVRRGLG